MGGPTFRAGRLLGIPIGIHPLWLLVVGLITWSLGATYFPDRDPSLSETAAYALGLLGALGLFAGILLHELGHAVVARRQGIEVEEIDLWLLGGVARMKGEAQRPVEELRFAAAGPAVTAIIAAVLGLLRLTIGDALPDWGLALLDYELYVNVAILAFNLLPAFPLDGGRIARSVLWLRSGDRRRSTERAAALGNAFGWFLLFLGGAAFIAGAIGGIWFGLIGWFLIAASSAESRASQLDQVIADRTVGELMTAPAVTLPAQITLAEAVVTGFARHLYSAFPVTDADGRAEGVLTLLDVRAVPPERRATTPVSAVEHRDAALLAARSAPAAPLLADPVFRRIGRAAVVDEQGFPVGVVSVTDIERRLRAEALLPGFDRPPGGTA